jgi:hypothetical protein
MQMLRKTSREEEGHKIYHRTALLPYISEYEAQEQRILMWHK